jgi:hypothetical protein
VNENFACKINIYISKLLAPVDNPSVCCVWHKNILFEIKVFEKTDHPHQSASFLVSIS